MYFSRAYGLHQGDFHKITLIWRPWACFVPPLDILALLSHSQSLAVNLNRKDGQVYENKTQLVINICHFRSIWPISTSFHQNQLSSGSFNAPRHMHPDLQLNCSSLPPVSRLHWIFTAHSVTTSVKWWRHCVITKDSSHKLFTFSC